MPIGRSDVSVADLVRAGLLTKGTILTWRDATATVTEDGRIACAGQLYSTPTTAAWHVRGVSVNGWRVWTVLVNGQRLTLDALRRRYRESTTGR